MPVSDEQVERARQLIAEGRSQRQACREVGVAESSFRKRLKAGPRAEKRGDTAEADSGRVPELPTEESLMAQMGFSRDEWAVDRAVVSNWGNPAEPMFQLKLWLRKKVPLEFLFPASDIKPPKLGKSRKILNGPQRVVVLGDHQAPYHNETLHRKSLELIAEFNPDRVIHLGDLLDFPTINKFRDNPPFDATPQECIDSGFRILRELREASPNAEWDLLAGNHDVRIATELLSRAERLHGIRPADFDGREVEALSLRRLLHLDRLGIRYSEPVGGYAHGEVCLHAGLAVRHGWLVGKTTAEKSLDALGRSVIVGHTHAKDHVWRLRSEGDRKVLRQAVVAGTMSSLELGYNVASDWHSGFVTVCLWPDGRFSVDHATWDEGHLLWRDRRF